MRNRLLVTLLLALPCFAVPAFGQAQPPGRINPTQVLFDGYIGFGAFADRTTFGKSVEDDIGVSLERSLGHRVEFLAGVRFSPYFDAGSGVHGQSALEDVRLNLWVKPRFALVGGVRASQEWFSSISKKPVRAIAGVSVRDSLFGSPGRFDLLGDFELGGCTFATPSNPCPITASRLRGGLIYQEFSVLPHLRVGIEAVMGRVGEQVNPFAPLAGQSHAFVASVLVVFRIPFFKDTSK